MAMERGGKRPGAGRKPGSPNKVSRVDRVSLTELAQSYTQQALDTLIDVMIRGQSESARVSAANSMLDRGHGKPKDAEPQDQGEAASLTVNINTSAPIGDIRVTRSDA